ncbi:MAG: VWA domain-containing protein [Bacteroidota bacterium]
MFRFEHIEHLWVLAAIPVLIIVFLFSLWQRQRMIKAFGNPELIRKMLPDYSRYKRPIKFGLITLAVLLLGVAWANPQWGSKKEKVKRKSADIMIALDISQSMYCRDIGPNRMERAKKFSQDLVNGLKGDRIGLTFFAGAAFLQTPLTIDYAALMMQLKSADPEMTYVQGTSIGAAIEKAMEGFESKSKNHRALVIITDGEDHEKVVQEMIRKAGEDGVLVFTVGVGTPAGGKIPIFRNGSFSNKRGRDGKEVISKLNEEMLRSIAEAGRGKYYSILNGEKVIESLQDRIEKLEKQEFEARTFSEYESYFQYFLAAAMILLILEFLISYRKNNLLKGRDLFNG